jgi:ribonuclease P protein component
MLGAGAPTGRFRSEDRLLDSRDFRRVMRRGRRRAGPDLVVFFAETRRENSEKLIENRELASETRSRLGLTVSRKVGNAVCRNRFKRRVRAWFRERRSELGRGLGLEGVDLIVIAKKSGGQLSLAELDERLSKLLGLGTKPR